MHDTDMMKDCFNMILEKDLKGKRMDYYDFEGIFEKAREQREESAALKWLSEQKKNDDLDLEETVRIFLGVTSSGRDIEKDLTPLAWAVIKSQRGEKRKFHLQYFGSGIHHHVVGCQQTVRSAYKHWSESIGRIVKTNNGISFRKKIMQHSSWDIDYGGFKICKLGFNQ